MTKSENECFFCSRAKNESIYSSKFVFVIRDNKFPVTKHHTLIATHRHVSDFFDLNNEELNDKIEDLTDTIRGWRWQIENLQAVADTFVSEVENL